MCHLAHNNILVKVWEKKIDLPPFSRRFKHAYHTGKATSVAMHASEGRSRFELQRRRCFKVNQRLGR